MTIPDSLPLFHSWPLFDAAARIGADRLAALAADPNAPLAVETDIGMWSCDLMDNDSLRWSPQVHALFGLPADEPLTRSLALACYAPRSRVAMEQLRAHAIHHRRGFTMDALIRRQDGEMRWMRLCAMPVLRDGKVVRLCGTKQDVTSEYDGPDWHDL